ncbi:ShlB/FhaC/HecB family hemolysin secretion/activation protein [Geitlerinema sp. PCC 9228]|uniref:ShlB/FhaC/HecB family hemolysin secretion/activation protein n=1 Tax=Geitlerinema sp. PCC 9228 TaxID=111611 RepID=UPI0008F9918C|nr:ShlB/FhaC/HecB family hemolysin secretion/activation protein [Geitlerinema sp. PCC 9228]
MKRKKIRIGFLFGLASLLGIGWQAVAAANPQWVSPTTEPTFPDRLLPRSSPTHTPATMEVLPDREPTVSQDSPETPIQVRNIVVSGSTILSPEQIQNLVSAYENRTLSLQDLQQAADKITQYYIERDYITSRAILPDQVVRDGMVRIQVLEGQLQAIEVMGNQQTHAGYIRRRLALAGTAPVNAAKLEEQLRLLRRNPLFDNVEATLKPGDKINSSILQVRVAEAKPWNITVGADNYSPPSVGSERFGMTVRYRNFTGWGDELTARYAFTQENGADSFDVSYRLPLNAKNGTLQLRAAPGRNQVIQEPFADLDIRGEREFYQVSFRQPLVRSSREEFALYWGITHQENETFTIVGPTPFGFGPDEDGISRITTLEFGQDYIRRHENSAWALRSQFNFGVDIFDATTNPDPIPDGRFFSWIARLQRVQRIGKDHLLVLAANLQLSPDGLLAPEQFIIGGGQSLRGYRQNVRSGDNGLRASVEGRFTVARDEAGLPTMQLAPFLDMGTVWNVEDNPNPLPDETFLLAVGLGMFWEPVPNFEVRLDYGIPLIDLDDRGDNIQEDGLHFRVNYRL